MSESSITATEPVDLDDVCFGKLCIGAECTNVAAVCGPCWMEVCVENHELQTKLRVAEATKKLAYAEIELVEKERDELQAKLEAAEKDYEYLISEALEAVTELKAHSAKAFIKWLGLQDVSVEVSGTEGGHPYCRKVSLTDALTDFIAAKRETRGSN